MRGHNSVDRSSTRWYGSRGLTRCVGTGDEVWRRDIGEIHESRELVETQDRQSRVYRMSRVTTDEVTEYRDRRRTRRHNEARNEELCHRNNCVATIVAGDKAT